MHIISKTINFIPVIVVEEILLKIKAIFLLSTQFHNTEFTVYHVILNFQIHFVDSHVKKFKLFSTFLRFHFPLELFITGAAAAQRVTALDFESSILSLTLLLVWTFFIYRSQDKMLTWSLETNIFFK